MYCRKKLICSSNVVFQSFVIVGLLVFIFPYLVHLGSNFVNFFSDCEHGTVTDFRLNSFVCMRLLADVVVLAEIGVL